MDYCKDWSQVKVTVKLEHLDTLVAIMSMLNNNLMIEDFSDIDLKTCYGDLIDETILNADKTVAAVSVFLPADRPFTDAVAFLRERMADSGFEGKVEVIGVSEEDWANSWKAYYKPLHIGKKMVIVPAWERYEAQPGEIIVRMDPGMAFGTGTHETTRLVIELLEQHVRDGMRVLDVGCGSGILAICAKKLGAAACKAYDIDPVAVRVARENIKDSGEENVTCDVSDLLKQVDLSGGRYDIVCANIVADIIIRMAHDVGAYMKDDAILLASGIITERAEEVVKALQDNGLRVADRLDDNGWCALVVKKA
ncbi:MAG: 50S ribosomal protein L11 methyltransferase [Ruminococcaceae bacterium]|nr:50S ribosomal protein L11 methyltransferase [Oscillospiraceae bacterium]